MRETTHHQANSSVICFHIVVQLFVFEFQISKHNNPETSRPLPKLDVTRESNKDQGFGTLYL